MIILGYAEGVIPSAVRTGFAATAGDMVKRRPRN